MSNTLRWNFACTCGQHGYTMCASESSLRAMRIPRDGVREIERQGFEAIKQACPTSDCVLITGDGPSRAEEIIRSKEFRTEAKRMIRVDYPACKHWAEYPTQSHVSDLCPKCSDTSGSFANNEAYYRRAGAFGDLLEVAPAIEFCEHDFRPSREKGFTQWCAKCGERK